MSHYRRSWPISAACWTTAGAANPWNIDDDRSPLDIHARVSMAAEAGFIGFGIRHMDLLEVERDIGLKAFRALLASHEIQFLEIEFLEHWYCDEPLGKIARNQIEDFSRFAGELGPRHIKVGPETDGRALDLRKFTESVHLISQKFEPFGCKLAIEAMPYADLKSPLTTLDVLEELNLKNVGIALDVWHVARAGISYDQLAAIPSDLIVTAELCDGTVQPEADLITDSIDGRLLPGHGGLGVDHFVEQLLSQGYEGPWGVEMLSAEFRAMDPEKAVNQSAQAALRVLDAGSRLY